MRTEMGFGRYLGRRLRLAWLLSAIRIRELMNEVKEELST